MQNDSPAIGCVAAEHLQGKIFLVSHEKWVLRTRELISATRSSEDNSCRFGCVKIFIVSSGDVLPDDQQELQHDWIGEHLISANITTPLVWFLAISKEAQKALNYLLQYLRSTSL